MTKTVQWLNNLLIDKLHIDPEVAGLLNTALLVAAMALIAFGLNRLIQSIFIWFSKHNVRLLRSKWHPFLVKRKLGHHVLLLIPGLVFYVLPYFAFEKGTGIIRILHRADVVYLLVVMIMIGNAILLAFLDFYSTTDKNRSHPLQGLIQGLQVILYFVGGIVIVAVLIDKSPTVLLTGLGASAAVLMLVFKDSILGFVAGVQLSQNNMIKLGDWIQMPDGSANGTVEQITLNTVKVRNWDNTLTMIPPYTLVTTPFKNWRGMQESGGRRADKCIYVDMTTLAVCDAEMIERIGRDIPLMGSYLKMTDGREGGPDSAGGMDCERRADVAGWKDGAGRMGGAGRMDGAGEADSGNVPGGVGLTNVQLYRQYIELYLKNNPKVNSSLDLIVTQKESTAYGLPIEVYFFTREKAWAVYEKQQSDIFDHLMTMAPYFGLRLYQRP